MQIFFHTFSLKKFLLFIKNHITNFFKKIALLFLIECYSIFGTNGKVRNANRLLSVRQIRPVVTSNSENKRF